MMKLHAFSQRDVTHYFISLVGTQRRKATIPSSSTSDCKTITTTAALQASGKESASGSMTKELRVPRLKVSVRPVAAGSRNTWLKLTISHRARIGWIYRPSSDREPGVIQQRPRALNTWVIPTPENGLLWMMTGNYLRIGKTLCMKVSGKDWISTVP